MGSMENHLFLFASPIFLVLEVQGFLQGFVPRCALLDTHLFPRVVPGHVVWWNILKFPILSKHLLSGTIYIADGRYALIQNDNKPFHLF